jgi:uncharacterized membrane protein
MIQTVAWAVLVAPVVSEALVASAEQLVLVAPVVSEALAEQLALAE